MTIICTCLYRKKRIVSEEQLQKKSNNKLHCFEVMICLKKNLKKQYCEPDSEVLSVLSYHEFLRPLHPEWLVFQSSINFISSGDVTVSKTQGTIILPYQVHGTVFVVEAYLKKRETHQELEQMLLITLIFVLTVAYIALFPL